LRIKSTFKPYYLKKEKNKLMINPEFYQHLLKEYGREVADNYSNVCLNLPETKPNKKKGRRLKHLPAEKVSDRAPKYKWGKLDLTAKQWAEALEIDPATFLRRLRQYGFCQKTFQARKYEYTATNEKKITWDGVTMNHKQWADALNISPKTLRRRFKSDGLSQKTFTPANHKHCYEKQITWGGKTLNIAGWAKQLNISPSTFYQRFKTYGLCEKIFRPGPHNMNKSRLITWRGETHTTTEWAKKLGISQPAFTQRMRSYGLCAKTFTPLRQNGNKRPPIEWQGEAYFTAEWAKKLNISDMAFKSRIQKFGLCEKTFTPGKLRPQKTTTACQAHVLSIDPSK
jgi:AraC-like DNA-binding protein